MNLLLIGASGMIGSCILKELSDRGHAVTAVSRNADKIAALPNVTAVSVDATDGAALAKAAEGAEIILSSSSPRSTGDAEADAKALGQGLLGAAKATGLPVLMVGGAGTLNLPDGSPVMALLPPEIKPEAMGIRALKDTLIEGGVVTTYLAPSAEIAPGERTGTFRVGADVLLSDADGRSWISAEDYAIAFADEVENPTHTGQVFTVGY